MTFDLETVLAGSDRRTLAAVVTHLTGDPNAVPDLRDREQIIRLAKEILPAFIRGEKEITPPSDEVLAACMTHAAGEDVDPSYGPLAREQLHIGPFSKAAPLSPPDDFKVVIIGGGVTGVLAGIRLGELGLDNYVIYDKNPEPGGTWWLNDYPGCRVDTPSLLYSYSFAIDRGWPKHFSHQPDLLEYVKEIVEESDIGDRLQSGAAVESMTWNDETGKWDLVIKRDDGSTEETSANFVFGATGLLRVPQFPPLEGMDNFKGSSFHSTDWDHSIDLSDKRIAIIGTGATANQVVPAIASTAKEVVVFQRTPHWMMSHPQYGKDLTGNEQSLIREIPTYMEWFRFKQFWQLGDSILPTLRVDPEWEHRDRSVNAANDKFRDQLNEYIKSQLGNEPELMEIVTPDYPPYGKRMLLDNGWYGALKRDNVSITNTPIVKITEDGVETEDGLEKVDVIAYCTGYHAGKIMWPIEITGKGGSNLRKRLDDDPEAYLGTAMQDAPNFLISSGPNSVPGHGGSFIFFSECQVNYMTEFLRTLFDNHWSRLEVREEALRKFVDETAEDLKTYVWSEPGISNWFTGGHDRVTAIVPKRLIDVWRDSKAVASGDYTGS